MQVEPTAGTDGFQLQMAQMPRTLSVTFASLTSSSGAAKGFGQSHFCATPTRLPPRTPIPRCTSRIPRPHCLMYWPSFMRLAPRPVCPRPHPRLVHARRPSTGFQTLAPRPCPPRNVSPVPSSLHTSRLIGPHKSPACMRRMSSTPSSPNCAVVHTPSLRRRTAPASTARLLPHLSPVAPLHHQCVHASCVMQCSGRVEERPRAAIQRSRACARPLEIAASLSVLLISAPRDTSPPAARARARTVRTAGNLSAVASRTPPSRRPRGWCSTAARAPAAVVMFDPARGDALLSSMEMKDIRTNGSYVELCQRITPTCWQGP